MTCRRLYFYGMPRQSSESGLVSLQSHQSLMKVSFIHDAFTCRTCSNVACDWSIPDPHLTALGQQQARSIPIAYPKLFDASDVILTSPLRRTIQSLWFGFPKLAEGKKRVEILPDLSVAIRRAGEWNKG